MIHSDVYDRLIKDDKDIKGQVAYVIYKKTKREFIRRMQTQLGTTVIPDDVMEEFYASQTDYTLHLYRNYAGQVTRESLNILYSEGNTVQNEGNYTVWNDSGTWWAGYDLTKDKDKDGIKERLTNRARSSGLVGSENITTYPTKTNNKYPEYNNNNAVWMLIRTNQR